MKAVTAFVALMLSANAAWADLSKVDLQSVEAAPPPGARLDLNLAARDMDGQWRRIGDALAGRPAFLVFVDYTCNTLCGTDLVLLGDAIKRAALVPSDFRILIVGIDPKDSAEAARAMETSELPADLQPSAVVLLPDQATVTRVTDALGYHFVYDAAVDQFAHPAAVYVIAADGLVRSVLSPFNLTTDDMSDVLATVAPRPSLYQQIHLLCYAYDPATGIYTARIDVLLKLAAAATLVLMGGAMLHFTRSGRRAR